MQTQRVKVEIEVLVHEAESHEGGYWAEVPALRGCVSEGETLDEVRSNIIEAIEGYLEALTDSRRPELNATARTP